MTTICTYTNQAEASLCMSMLQAYGFQAVLLDEGSFQWNYAAGAIPIRLQVPEHQAGEALACLQAMKDHE